ncbi:MAG: hypothetical protein M3Z09_10320 [Acidobacteriota bacterium]|nr:hypothetical protein [Acidobacteriota bacterium]
MKITDEDVYNTDGNGVIRIVEREDGLFAEAANAEGPFTGADAETAAIAGAAWLPSPNEVIEAWYATFRDHGQLIRPNVR